MKFRTMGLRFMRDGLIEDFCMAMDNSNAIKLPSTKQVAVIRRTHPLE